MEFNHLNTETPESSDDSLSKKEKKDKKKRVAFVPVPLDIEASRAMRQQQEVSKAHDDEEQLKKKKRRAKKQQIGAIASPIEEAKEAEEDKEAPAAKAEVTEDTEPETATAENAPAEDEIITIPEVVKSAPVGFAGELPISERARRIHESRLQQNALEQAPEGSVDTLRNPLEDALDEKKVEELIAEISEYVNDSASHETMPEDEEDDEDATTPISASTPTTSTTKATTSATSTSATPPPPLPPVTPIRTPVPPVPVGPVVQPGGPPIIPTNPNVYSPIGPQSPNVLPTSVSQNITEVVPDKRAERRNLLTGLLLGGLIEHVRHKSRERRMEKQHTEQIKHLTAEQQDAAMRAAEKEKAALQSQTVLEKQLARLKEQTPQLAEAVAAPVLKPVERGKAENYVPAAATETVPNRPLTAQEKLEQSWAKERAIAQQKQEMRESKRNGSSQFVTRTEGSGPLGNGEKPFDEASLARAKQEQVRAAESSAAEENAEIPDDHRVEKSAWLNIEVDKKTGKAVENPAVEYGEEFKHEQHQEQLRREIEDASLESENMRQRYVAPHMLTPTPPTYGGQQPTAQTGPVGDGKEPYPNEKSDNGLGLADMILWGVLFVVIVAIIMAIMA